VTGGRSVMAPEVPPLRDAGVVMQDLEVWTALVGPAKLSKAANERLSREVPTLVRDGEVRQRLFTAGWQAQGGAPEALRLRVKSETACSAASSRCRTSSWNERAFSAGGRRWRTVDEPARRTPVFRRGLRGV
jgi:hypothetical protein